MFSLEIRTWESNHWNLCLIERFLFIYYWILVEFLKWRYFFLASQNDLLNNWYNSITQLNYQLVVPLESTSSPYYEWKGKCKDYHQSSPSETYYIHVNYVPYLYEYEGIIPLLIINNSGINGAESKWDSDLMLLMNQSNEYTRNKFLYDFW